MAVTSDCARASFEPRKAAGAAAVYLLVSIYMCMFTSMIFVYLFIYIYVLYVGFIESVHAFVHIIYTL